MSVFVSALRSLIFPAKMWRASCLVLLSASSAAASVLRGAQRSGEEATFLGTKIDAPVLRPVFLEKSGASSSRSACEDADAAVHTAEQTFLKESKHLEEMDAQHDEEYSELAEHTKIEVKDVKVSLKARNDCQQALEEAQSQERMYKAIKSKTQSESDALDKVEKDIAIKLKCVEELAEETGLEKDKPKQEAKVNQAREDWEAAKSKRQELGNCGVATVSELQTKQTEHCADGNCGLPWFLQTQISM